MKTTEVIQTGPSRTGCGAVCQRIKTRGVWSSQEPNYHHNILEFLVAKLALISFPKAKKQNLIHYQIITTTALTYPLKMGEQKWENNRIMQENLRLAFVLRDPNY